MAPLRGMTRTDQIEGHAEDDEGTSHLILVTIVRHQDECATSDRLDGYGEEVGLGVGESHRSYDLWPRSSTLCLAAKGRYLHESGDTIKGNVCAELDTTSGVDLDISECHTQEGDYGVQSSPW